MIHINRGDGQHEMLTDEEYQMRYPEAYARANRVRPWEAVGRSLSQVRKDADLSIRELAKRLDMRASELSDLELGRDEPSDEFMTRYFAAVLELREERRAL